MNVIKFKTKDFEMEVSFNGNGIAAIEKDGTQVGFLDGDKDAYAAVIALALHQYSSDFQGDHDEESCVITLVPHSTDWNAKSNVMNRRLSK